MLKNNVRMESQQETEEINKYWENIREKTNSILELLKGASYQEIKEILEGVDYKVNSRLQHLTVF
jgi:hypothetical protein